MELPTPEIMKLLGSTKKDVGKDKDSKNVPKLEFVINISPCSLTMTNTVNAEFSSVEVWFTDEVSKALEIEDNVNLMLITG